MDTDLKRSVHPLTDAFDMISPNQFTDSQIHLYYSLVAGISNMFSKSDKSLLQVAFRVEEIYRNRFYVIDGYKTIYDFMKSRFSFSRGKTSNYINIVNNFCEWVDNDGKAEPSGKILKEYKNFSITQLTIMLGMNEITRKKCKPDMTTRELKELRRESNDDGAAIEGSPPEEPLEEPENSVLDHIVQTDVSPDQQIEDILVLSVDDISDLSADDIDLLLDALECFKKNCPDQKPVFKISIGIE